MSAIFMICPARACHLQIEVSHEDPDASQSEMWRHLATAHYLDAEATALLADVRVVDSGGQILSDAEVMAWMFGTAAAVSSAPATGTEGA